MSADLLGPLASPHGPPHPLADSAGRLSLLVSVPRGADPAALGLLPLTPGLGTVRLSPDEAGPLVAAHPELGFSAWPARHLLLDESTKWNRTDVYRASLATQANPIRGTGRGVIVGILDTGIDLSHPDFLDASGNTRVAWLLDMSHDPLGIHADLEAQFGCSEPSQRACAILSAEDINKVLRTGKGELPADVVGHGTHVASIAAGNGGTDAKYIGTAPEATLVIAAVTHGSVGEVDDADIVNGAKFVFDRAENMQGGRMPAVVNLSLGGDFGPHNGTTPLETALATLVGPDHAGRAIVVAAGNSGSISGGSEGEIFGIHTEVRVTADAPAHVPLRSPGEKGDPVLKGRVYVWMTYGPEDHIAAGLTGPDGIHIKPVPKGKLDLHKKESTFIAAIENAQDDPEAGLFANMNSAILLWNGQWAAGSTFTIDLEGEGVVQMWIEGQDDAAPSDKGYGQRFETATVEQTVGLPATHPSLLAVGCTVDRNSWKDTSDNNWELQEDVYGKIDGACRFSSAGPTATGVRKPEISAPGALVVAAMSARSSPAVLGSASIFAPPQGACGENTDCFVADANHALLSGSSMSAPQVAGAVALLLEQDPSLTQDDVRTVLQQGARYPTGWSYYDYQLGAGVLDVAGAIAALEARGAESAAQEPVDPTHSWMSLSASYMRPDPEWPLTGTVALRSATGALADVASPSQMALKVDGPAQIRQDLTRMGVGMYTFELRADANDGQQMVTIDVSVDGKSIGPANTRFFGHRLIPVGPDRWIAHGRVSATGGCATAAMSESAKGSALCWLAAGVMTLGARRRRQRRHSDDSATRHSDDSVIT